MGALVPNALQAIQTIGTVATFASQGAAIFSDNKERQSRQTIEQLQRQQALSQQQAIANANLQKQQNAAQTEAAEKERRAALKRAVARQRAQFGASGVASGDGSSEAVLLGLFEESDEERTSRERLDKLKEQSLDQGIFQSAQTNTLKRTQLAERERLKNATSPFEQTTKLLGLLDD